MTEIIALKIDTDGIAELHWDDPTARVNLFSSPAIAEFGAQVERIALDDGIRGVVITSGKKTFHAGADLNMVKHFFEKSAEEMTFLMSGVMDSFVKLEACGKPVAAAINGHALGGGFELILATHARFVANDPTIRMGLPEAAIGLMPGFGGTQRMPRIARYQEATRLVLDGTTFNPQAAYDMGLVTEIVEPSLLKETARAWVAAQTEAHQPWNRNGYSATSNLADFRAFSDRLQAELAAQDTEARPELPLIVGAVLEGLQMPMKAALRHEIRCFVELTRSQVAKNTLLATFFKDAS